MVWERFVRSALDEVAGTGTAGFNGGNIPPTAAEIYGPSDMCVDSSGNFFIVDQGNACARQVLAATNLIQAFAGQCGSTGSSGAGGPAASA